MKSKSYTYGEFKKENVQKAVLALENINIERKIEKSKSLQFMTARCVKARGNYIKRSESQDILKAFRVGDWRIGIKELKKPGLPTKCPFGCQTLFDLPHFMFWCPQLDVVRRETGISDFFHVYNSASYEDNDIIRRFLWASDDDPDEVRKHGQTVIRMRNSWYKAAVSKKINLNVRIIKLL